MAFTNSKDLKAQIDFYYRDVYRVCLNLLRDQEMATDVTVKTFHHYYLHVKGKGKKLETVADEIVKAKLCYAAASLCRELKAEAKNEVHGDVDRT